MLTASLLILLGVSIGKDIGYQQAMTACQEIYVPPPSPDVGDVAPIVPELVDDAQAGDDVPTAELFNDVVFPGFRETAPGTYEKLPPPAFHEATTLKKPRKKPRKPIKKPKF